MRIAQHPLWLVGFRPFFAFAFLSGMALPALWALVFAGRIALPASPVPAVQWHAHEMFFGFGWAVLGGFLLTASKNWVKVRGHHGAALVFLAAAWLFERIGMGYGGAWPPVLFRVSNLLFLAAIVTMLAWTLIRHRKDDAYRDNYFFLLVLPAFAVAKIWMLDAETMQAGWSMAIGLFRVAFLVMLERTLSQFMKGVFQADILRRPALDGAIKLLALGLALEPMLPPALAATLAGLLALLLAGRFLFWKPLLALRRLDIGIMYIGYLAIVAQLLSLGLDRTIQPAWMGSVSVHLFTFGVMGLIIPAMMIRISQGHTGRKVVFAATDKAVLWIMMFGLVLRIAAPQAFPGHYLLWIDLAAACWFAGFAILAGRYLPFLLRPRIDGKEH